MTDTQRLMEESVLDRFKEFADAFPSNRKKYVNYTVLLVHDRDAAEDLVNDSFARMWERRNEIADTNIEAYFYITMKSVCLNWLRHKYIQNKVHKRIEDTSQRLLQHDIASLEAFDPTLIFSTEIREIMHRQLENMPELSRMIFMDNRFRDLSYEEIAGKYGIPKFKVRNEIQSVLTRLRISLRDYLPTALIAALLGQILF